mmetsp:Transcript_15318/g.20285  ORF Transcript_15318/g.20285 Transcript_15318/m.20285 type:complete len:201 (+) Transcript_15318:102-704(+)
MAFTKSALLAVIAATSVLLSADAFVAPSTSLKTQTSFGVPKFSPIASSLAEDDVAEAEEADDFIVSAGDLDDEEAGEDDDLVVPEWYAHQLRIKELREQYRRHESDTGSPEFQVAGMTERISYLTKHLKEHPKDFSTRRGLVALVNKRRRLLNYLFREDIDRYQTIVSSMGIRHKAPGRVQSREDKYGRFPPQKVRKGGR